MHETNGKLPSPESLALDALVWTISDSARAERLLGLTGLTPDRLRAGLSEAATQSAVLLFLESHEPDLLACADALGCAPGQLVAARQLLEGAIGAEMEV